jgi:hypothetical protein
VKGFLKFFAIFFAVFGVIGYVGGRARRSDEAEKAIYGRLRVDVEPSQHKVLLDYSCDQQPALYVYDVDSDKGSDPHLDLASVLANSTPHRFQFGAYAPAIMSLAGGSSAGWTYTKIVEAFEKESLTSTRALRAIGAIAGAIGGWHLGYWLGSSAACDAEDFRKRLGDNAQWRKIEQNYFKLLLARIQDHLKQQIPIALMDRAQQGLPTVEAEPVRALLERLGANDFDATSADFLLVDQLGHTLGVPDDA